MEDPVLRREVLLKGVPCVSTHTWGSVWSMPLPKRAAASRQKSLKSKADRGPSQTSRGQGRQNQTKRYVCFISSSFVKCKRIHRDNQIIKSIVGYQERDGGSPVEPKLPYIKSAHAALPVLGLVHFGLKPDLLVGWRLRHFRAKWEKLTQDQVILEAVAGFQVPFVEQSKQLTIPPKPRFSTLVERNIMEEIQKSFRKML